MFDPSCLVWTSRAEVASALLAAVDSSPEHSLRAMELCAAVATPAHAPALLAVARARERPYWLRVYAIRAFVAAEADPAPDDVVESLFVEWFFERDAPRVHGFAAADPLALRDVLPLVATPAHARIAMRWLARAPPDVRAAALVENALAWRPVAVEVFRWLGDEWRDRGGAGCSDEMNVAVARHVFPAQPEGAAVLARYWADAPTSESEQFPFDRAVCPALAVGEAFEEHRALATWRLALPAAELARALHPRWLRYRLRRAVEERSCANEPPPHASSRAEVARVYRGALAVLRDASDGPVIVSGFLRGLALSPQVRADLVRVLLRRDPAAAIDLVASRLGAEDDLPALRVVLEALGDSGPGWRDDSPDDAPPVPAAVAHGAAARALATRSLRLRDADARYLAVGAAEATGAARAWCDTHCDQGGPSYDLVRVRVLAALARGGDREAEAQLSRAAANELRVEVRAEALRRLGELPRAAMHRGRFADALANDHARFGPDALDAPAAEQAALALARIGDGHAKTDLLRGAFGPLTVAAVAVVVAGLRAGPCEACGEWPCDPAERRRAIAAAEGWRLTRWSPLRASRFATVDD
ncbi:MAG: hypothetical protein U0324_29875 [Polyangiales bacterium]